MDELLAVFLMILAVGSTSALEVCDGNKYVKDSRLTYGVKPALCEVLTAINLTASSYGSTGYHGADQGTITGRGTLTDHDVDDMSTSAKNPYANVTISSVRQICGVIIGGRSDFGNDRAQMFQAEVTKDGVTWVDATVDKSRDIPAGCSVSTRTTTVFFTSAIEGNKMRITATKVVGKAAVAFRIAVIVDCSTDTSQLSTCFTCSASATWRCNNRRDLKPSEVTTCYGFSCTKKVDKSGHVITRGCQQHACSQAVITSDADVTHCCTGFGCNSAADTTPSVVMTGLSLLMFSIFMK